MSYEDFLAESLSFPLDPTPAKFVQLLLLARANVQLSQSLIAEYCSVAQSSVFEWLRGNRTPNLTPAVMQAALEQIRKLPPKPDLAAVAAALPGWESVTAGQITPAVMLGVGLRLKLLRKPIASQEEFALAVDVAPTQLCKWERGKKLPSVAHLRKIALFLRCTLEELEQQLSKALH